jgi:Fe-S cluster biogenesis protein NfuA
MFSSSARILARTARSSNINSTSRFAAKSPVFPSSAFLQQLRSIFIQTSETPNPESLKFIPTGVTVIDSEDGTSGFYVTKQDSANDILRSPLAKSLFDVQGVKAVYLGSDFVTVTKFAEHKWKMLRPQLFEVLMNWADKGEPALLDAPLITDTTILDDDDEIVAMIKELIESRIRPAVQEDGGDIRYVSFSEETGLVTVQLAGSCVGCPSSAITLKNGVENMLMHYIPEVSNVIALEDEGGEEVGEEDETEAPEEDVAATKQKSYEERLAAAGIPFSE